MGRREGLGGGRGEAGGRRGGGRGEARGRQGRGRGRQGKRGARGKQRGGLGRTVDASRVSCLRAPSRSFHSSTMSRSSGSELIPLPVSASIRLTSGWPNSSASSFLSASNGCPSDHTVETSRREISSWYLAASVLVLRCRLASPPWPCLDAECRRPVDSAQWMPPPAMRAACLIFAAWDCMTLAPLLFCLCRLRRFGVVSAEAAREASSAASVASASTGVAVFMNAVSPKPGVVEPVTVKV